MFSLLKKYELRGAKRRVRLFNRFQIESVLKIAPYHTLKFGGIGKSAYLCTVVRRKAALDKLPFFFFTFNRDKTAKRGNRFINSLIINLISISLQP